MGNVCSAFWLICRIFANPTAFVCPRCGGLMLEEDDGTPVCRH